MKLLGAIIEGEDIVNKKYVDDGLSENQKVFVAVYEQTTYADVKAAIDENKVIVLKMTANKNQFCMTYSTYTNGGNVLMHAIYKMNDNQTLTTVTLTPSNNWTTSHTYLQDRLVSGTNIKTVNNLSLLGSGNIDIEGGGSDNTWIVAQVDVTTYNEVETAVLSNKSIVVKTSNSSYYDLYPMLDVDSNGDDRIAIHIEHGTYYVTNDDVWTYSDNGELVENYTLNLRTGALQDLDTDDKSNLVNAINEVHTKSSALATETAAGIVKLNPSENITLNANGQLQVGGRIGQFSSTTGLFAPNDREPRNVGNYSFLITDAKGMDLNANRAFALVSGLGVTCKSAAAGATEYRVTNNYSNRIICKMAEGGYASISESVSSAERIVQVTSVTINGSSFTPSSSGDSSNDIVIKTAQSLNPSSATTSIRLFGKMGSYATAHIGNGVRSDTGGRHLLLGGGVTKTGSSNDDCLIGNGIYASGNGNACFGRYHIAVKNRGFLAGTGHDTTNAPAEGASAVGQYSYMDSNTLFAVGNGSSHTDRKNALEVRSDGIVLRSPNGTRYKLVVDDSGNLTTTAI